MSTYREDAERRIVSEQAAYWLCELADGNPEQHDAFVAWLKRSPHHVGEFLNASIAWKEFGRTRPFSPAEMEKIVAEARAQRDLCNVVAFEGIAGTIENPRPSVLTRQSRRLVRAAAAIGVVGLSSGILAAWLISSNAQTYSTAVGEQRAFRLEDGSL